MNSPGAAVHVFRQNNATRLITERPVGAQAGVQEEIRHAVAHG